MDNEDIKIWEKIKRGEIKNICLYDECIEICEFFDDYGKKIYARHHNFIKLNVPTLRDMLYNPKIVGKKVYIYPYSELNPFHEEHNVLMDPMTMRPKDRITKYLSVALHKIPSNVGTYYKRDDLNYVLDDKSNIRRLLLIKKI